MQTWVPHPQFVVMLAWHQTFCMAHSLGFSSSESFRNGYGPSYIIYRRS